MTGVVPQQQDAIAAYMARHNVNRIGQKHPRSAITPASFGYGRDIAGHQIVRRDIAILCS